MKQKLLLIVIGIVAVIAVSCRAKSENIDVINTDNASNEAESEDITTSTDEQSDTENPNNIEPTNKTENEDIQDSTTSDENEDIQDSTTSDETEENRNNTYKDVDIKVPSIHED